MTLVKTDVAGAWNHTLAVHAPLPAGSVASRELPAAGCTDMELPEASVIAPPEVPNIGLAA
jgi:hypothetical protein